MESTTTTIDVEEFDPLDDPQIKATYERIRIQRGQIAAGRYLLTVKPTDGMTATTPTVTTRDRSQEQKQTQTTATTVQAARSTTVQGTVTSLLTETTPAAGVETGTATNPTADTGLEVEPIVESIPPTAETADLRAAETPEAPPDSPTDAAPESVDLDAPIPEAESHVTTSRSSDRPARKPARSTAQVKEAFETALAQFVKADQPFKRTHVLVKAGLGAGFYNTYPSLKTKVDQAIANVGKPKPQPEAPMNQTTAETETTAPVETEPSVSQEVAEPPLIDSDPVNADAGTGQLTATQSTTLSHGRTPVAGLTWDNMAGLAAHWRDEQVHLKQQISQLLVDLDTATENAEAYERILSLHTTQALGESHEP